LSNNNGRFLKRTKNKNRQWIVLFTAQAHTKSAHAIQYRLRKKALQRGNSRQGPTTTPGGGTAPLSQFSRTSRPCSSRACQQTALLCSTLCQYCHSLAVYRQWYYHYRPSRNSSGFVPTSSSRHEHVVSIGSAVSVASCVWVAPLVGFKGSVCTSVVVRRGYGGSVTGLKP
jgi:hypothetical protein